MPVVALFINPVISSVISYVINPVISVHVAYVFNICCICVIGMGA
jgi:hypothetical protein